MRKLWVLFVLTIFLAGCATFPKQLQPSITEPHGVINISNDLFIDSIDNNRMGFYLFRSLGSQDIRISPGEHVVSIHYNSPGVFAQYSGSTLSLPITIKEGVRSVIRPEVTRSWGIQRTWKPVVVKEETIDGYAGS